MEGQDVTLFQIISPLDPTSKGRGPDCTSLGPLLWELSLGFRGNLGHGVEL